MEQDKGAKLHRKARQEGGRKRRWMQNSLRDGGGIEGAKTVPELGNGEHDKRAKSPFTARSSKTLFDILFYQSIFEEFIPR